MRRCGPYLLRRVDGWIRFHLSWGVVRPDHSGAGKIKKKEGELK